MREKAESYQVAGRWEERSLWTMRGSSGGGAGPGVTRDRLPFLV